MSDPPSLVIGVGNRDRGDDGAGPAVCDLVAELAPGSIRTVVLETSAIDLVEHWGGDDRAVIVDAGRPSGEPGRVVEYDGLEGRFAVPGTTSTHSIDLAGGVELARALGRLPAALTIVSIEGATFDLGAPLTEEVRRRVRAIASQLVRGEPPGSRQPADGRHTGTA